MGISYDCNLIVGIKLDIDKRSVKIPSSLVTRYDEFSGKPYQKTVNKSEDKYFLNGVEINEDDISNVCEALQCCDGIDSFFGDGSEEVYGLQLQEIEVNIACEVDYSKSLPLIDKVRRTLKKMDMSGLSEANKLFLNELSNNIKLYVFYTLR